MAGRSDKRFCSERCRAAFNNQQKIDSEGHVREDLRIIRKNARILYGLYEHGKKVEGKVSIHKNVMERKGFHFKRFTMLFMEDRYLPEFLGIGGYGYRFVEDSDHIEIIKIQPNVERI
jgi:hypothetical protein